MPEDDDNSRQGTVVGLEQFQPDWNRLADNIACKTKSWSALTIYSQPESALGLIWSVTGGHVADQPDVTCTR